MRTIISCGLSKYVELQVWGSVTEIIFLWCIIFLATNQRVWIYVRCIKRVSIIHIKSPAGLLIQQNMASKSLSVIRYDPTHFALHSSNVVARLTSKYACPGLPWTISRSSRLSSQGDYWWYQNYIFPAILPIADWKFRDQRAREWWFGYAMQAICGFQMSRARIRARRMSPGDSWFFLSVADLGILNPSVWQMSLGCAQNEFHFK